MRIVQLLTQSSGGPADHAVDVACELARRGHDSHVVGPLSVGSLRRVHSAGVHHHEAQMRSKTDVRGAQAVLDVLRHLRADVLHCQDRRAGLIGRTTRHVNRVPGIVYTLHGVADGLSDLVAGNVRAAARRRRDRWYYLTGERWLSAIGHARVVVPSRAVAQFALEHVRLPEDRVDVVPNGVDIERFTPQARTTASPPTAVWLGLMAPVKRLDVLVEALADVPDLCMRLVGTGPGHSAVHQDVSNRNLLGRVTFCGEVAAAETAFADADLFVLTSAAENCPLALLQAMACGLPVVASSVGGIPEIVENGRQGLLVPPGDPNALADALRRLSADPPTARAMGVQARERVLARFTVARCVDGLLESYEKAIAWT